VHDRPSRPHAFASTRWSLVAGGAEVGEQGRRALGELCEIYCFPLYAYVPRQGIAAADAEDLVQGCLGLLIERNDLATLDASRFLHVLALIIDCAVEPGYQLRIGAYLSLFVLTGACALGLWPSGLK
tara:strand:+ start:18425 stop:18805 length:381 start_codon:yes stop_codon:yes gene_type:complete